MSNKSWKAKRGYASQKFTHELKRKLKRKAAQPSPEPWLARRPNITIQPAAYASVVEQELERL